MRRHWWTVDGAADTLKLKASNAERLEEVTPRAGAAMVAVPAVDVEATTRRRCIMTHHTEHASNSQHAHSTEEVAVAVAVAVVTTTRRSMVVAVVVEAAGAGALLKVSTTMTAPHQARLGPREVNMKTQRLSICADSQARRGLAFWFACAVAGAFAFAG